MTFVLTGLLALIQKTRAERQPTDENNVSDYEHIFNSSCIEFASLDTKSTFVMDIYDPKNWDSVIINKDMEIIVEKAPIIEVDRVRFF